MSAVVEAAAAAADLLHRAERRALLVQRAIIEADAAEVLEFTKLAALLRELARAVAEDR